MTEHTIDVRRRDPDDLHSEFVAYVNDDPVLTSTQLQDRGYRGPYGPNDWQDVLRTHALSYCDGLDAAGQ